MKILGYTLRYIKFRNEGIYFGWFPYKKKPIVARAVIPRGIKTQIRESERLMARIERRKMEEAGLRFLEKLQGRLK